MAVADIVRWIAILVLFVACIVVVVGVYLFTKKPKNHLIYAIVGGLTIASVDCLFEEIMVRVGAWSLNGGTYLFGFNVPVEMFVHFLFYGILISTLINPKNALWVIWVALGSAVNALFDWFSIYFGLLLLSPSVNYFHIVFIWILLNLVLIFTVYTLMPNKNVYLKYCIENKGKLCEVEK
jgi:hypothetical protein